MQYPYPPDKQMTVNMAMDELHQLRPFVRYAENSRRGSWISRQRRLLDYLLVYIDQGKGYFSVGDESFKVKAGDLIWIPPDTPHEMEGLPPAMCVPYVHFDLNYDPNRSFHSSFIKGGTLDLTPVHERLHPPVAVLPFKRLSGKLAIPNRDVIGRHMIELSYQYRHDVNHWILSGMLTRILGDILRGLNSKGTIKAKHWLVLQNAARQVQDNLDAPLDVELLARRARMSLPHFRRLFRQVFDISPRAMHCQLRITRARELLSQTGFNITEIAHQLGYSTVHNFSRAFSDTTGCSPKQYRAGLTLPL